jgi:hypothetical protein
MKILFMACLPLLVSCATNPPQAQPSNDCRSPAVSSAQAGAGESWSPPDFTVEPKPSADVAVVPADTIADQPDLKSGQKMAHLARRTVQQAKQLYGQGQKAEALALVEAIQVQKPEVLEWLDSAAQLEAWIRGEEERRTEMLAPLTKQISNYMAIKADYAIIRMATDSLRSLNLPDSLRRWSLQQDSIALKRSIQKLQVYRDSIHHLVMDKAKYAEARKILAILQGAHPEIRSGLKLDSLSAWLDSESTRAKEQWDSAFWKKRTPSQVLKEANALRDARKWTEAKALYSKLESSPLRKEARTESLAMSEVYCNEARKKAAEFYGKKQYGPAGKVLQDCLDIFPEYPQVEKVRQNLQMLQNEILKSKGTSP